MLVYRVMKQPDGPFGLAVYLLMGRAGDGVLVGDRWFHFRKGKFVKDSRKTLMRKPGYIISPVREATLGDVGHFNRTVGKSWGLRHNCLTTVTLRLMK